MDRLAWMVAFGAIAMFAALAAAMRLAWENAGSRTVLLATATLAAASVLFVVQVWFELQSSTSREYVGLEYTVNHETASVGQWAYADVMRARAEIDASNWLRAKDASVFDRDGARVAADFAMFSLIDFVVWEEYDWQLERTEFKGEVLPGLTVIESPSTDKDSTTVKQSELEAQLSATGNLFAGADLGPPGRSLRLPPGSTIKIGGRSLSLLTPVCSVVWELKPALGSVYIDPRTRTVSPMLPSGKQKLETLTQRFLVTVKFSGLHSQRRDISKYRGWTNRLLVDCHRWFEQRGAETFEDNGVTK